MIQLASLTKGFGERILLENVSWQIDARERVGLCGPNGAGKTTLLRMLAGLEEPDAGAIVRPADLSVGYLPQDGLVHQGRTLFEEASSAFQPLLDLKTEMHDIEQRLADASVGAIDHDQMLSRYSELQDGFRAREGYSIDLKVATVLGGLGFERSDFGRATETFSGGWQMRIALARLLLGRPNLLLLDEPTNHLDLEARNWLETYLREYPHAVILVSHDRFFLDTVVTRITDVGLKTLTDYNGNYSDYLTERTARFERLREQKRRQDEEVARVRQFIDRFRYQATKASQVQSRLKMLEKVVSIDVPPERKKVRFSFPPCAKSGRLVFELRDVRKTYEDKVVFKRLDLHIERGDRVAIVGQNGAGKSTLMRLLSGVEPLDSGTRHEGHQVVLQYFAQDEASRLDTSLSVYETLAAGSPNQMVPQIRNILGGFLFSGDDAYKPVSVLSGGERTRLAVARMLLHPANTLLLDEPTNHLDLDSKDVLLDALMDFGGTLIIVSHDRYFLDRLATKIVDVGGGEGVTYPGTYEQFHWRKEHEETANTTSAPQTVVSKLRPRAQRPHVAAGYRPATSHPPAQVSRQARKQAGAVQRSRKRAADQMRERIAQIETRIAECERAIREIEASMATPGFYDDRDAARPVIDQHQTLMWEVGDLMHKWEELQTSVADNTATET